MSAKTTFDMQGMLQSKSDRLHHKRVYRIYCELELNLRIKPRKRLKRDKPDALAVPEAPNLTWSMDFMADRLGDGRAFRLLERVRQKWTPVLSPDTRKNKRLESVWRFCHRQTDSRAGWVYTEPYPEFLR